MKKSIGQRTALYPCPALVVGTYDSQGAANMMTVAWGGICCSKPPCIAISVRKATHTYGNLIAQQAFTVNIPSEGQMKETDYFGIASGKDNDKIAAAGMTAVKSELINAPYLEEFPVILECKVLHVHELGLHIQFVGEVLDAKADEEILGEKGNPDMTKLKGILFAEGNYYGFGELAFFPGYLDFESASRSQALYVALWPFFG